jgi:hypothetical protein
VTDISPGRAVHTGVASRSALVVEGNRKIVLSVANSLRFGKVLRE